MAVKADFNQISIYKTPENSPGYLLWRVSTRWRRSVEAALKPYDLTHAQFVILATTAWLTKEGKKVSQNDVSRLAEVDTNTLSQILRCLQKKGLIERPHLRDRKAKNPTLTAEGLARLNQALPAVEKVDEQFFSTLGEHKEEFLKELQNLALRGE